jgi:guanine deaminase
MACFALRGTAYHTPSYGQLEALRDVVLVVRDGKIARVAPGAEEATVLREFGLSSARRLQVRRHGLRPPALQAAPPEPLAAPSLQEGQYLVPGFIDTHVHAPQVPRGAIKVC